MMQYRQIEIDVDVNRWIESKRTSFDQTHNDILRTEAGLQLSPQYSPAAPGKALNGEAGDAGSWAGKGVTLPAGTRLRMTYNGKIHTGLIQNGNWLVNGERHVSPSAAASAAAEVSLNGWIYWEAQLPGTAKWQPISTFRTMVARRRVRRAS
jgi:hypothetical protein